MSFLPERRGSSKDIFGELDHKGRILRLYFKFSDRVSIFDRGELPTQFPGLGQLRCAIAGKIFQALNSAGFLTHYISHDVAAATMNVQPVNIPALGVHYGKFVSHTIMPVELLARLTVTKKLLARIDRDEVDSASIERLMAGDQLREGIRLYHAFVECSTKFEKSDRYLRDKEAAELIGITETQLRGYYVTVQNVFEFLYTYFRSNGFFLLMDGKLEASLAPDGIMMLVDSISPDELRLIGPNGQSYDKDPVRQWYEENHPVWVAGLKLTKFLYPDDKSKWPEYPAAPPPELIEEVLSRCRAVAEVIGAI